MGKSRTRRHGPVREHVEGEHWARLHRGTGQAYLLVDGKRIWLGRYFCGGSADPEMVTRARRWLAEHRVRGGGAAAGPRVVSESEKGTSAES